MQNSERFGYELIHPKDALDQMFCTIKKIVYELKSEAADKATCVKSLDDKTRKIITLQKNINFTEKLIAKHFVARIGE